MENNKKTKHMNREEVIENLLEKKCLIEVDPKHTEDDIKLCEDAIYYVETCDQIVKYLKSLHIQARREMDFEKEEIMGKIVSKINTFLEE